MNILIYWGDSNNATIKATKNDHAKSYHIELQNKKKETSGTQ